MSKIINVLLLKTALTPSAKFPSSYREDGSDYRINRTLDNIRNQLNAGTEVPIQGVTYLTGDAATVWIKLQGENNFVEAKNWFKAVVKQWERANPTYTITVSVLADIGYKLEAA